MINKRSSFYLAIFSFFISILIVLMILLYVEYRFFCSQANELLLLKKQYTYYVDILRKKINTTDDNAEIDHTKETIHEENNIQLYTEMIEDLIEESPLIIDEIIAAESSDAPDNDDEYIEDSFVVINRQADYLKQSTFDYIESQELNALMTAIDIDRWSDYTDSFVTEAPPNKTITNKKTTAQLSNTTNKQKKSKGVITPRRAIKECGFIWPIDIDKFWLSSLFGPRKRIDGTWGFHHGIDMAAEKGRVVKAVQEGMVMEASFQVGYGNTVVIEHASHLKTRYAHLHTIRVYVGQKVKQGNIIGTVGETGFIRKKGKDGSHLHFEVYEQGKRINPLHCLPRVT